MDVGLEGLKGVVVVFLSRNNKQRSSWKSKVCGQYKMQTKRRKKSHRKAKGHSAGRPR